LKDLCDVVNLVTNLHVVRVIMVDMDLHNIIRVAHVHDVATDLKEGYDKLKKRMKNKLNAKSNKHEGCRTSTPTKDSGAGAPRAYQPIPTKANLRKKCEKKGNNDIVEGKGIGAMVSAASWGGFKGRMGSICGG
jgi:hypothetical protein